jgi:hypothetical protein
MSKIPVVLILSLSIELLLPVTVIHDCPRPVSRWWPRRVAWTRIVQSNQQCRFAAPLVLPPMLDGTPSRRVASASGFKLVSRSGEWRVPVTRTSESASGEWRVASGEATRSGR